MQKKSMEEIVKQTKNEIIRGIIESDQPKDKLRSLPDISDYLPDSIERKYFARAVDGLSREGVLPIKPTPVGPAYGFNPEKARQNGYI